MDRPFTKHILQNIHFEIASLGLKKLVPLKYTNPLFQHEIISLTYVNNITFNKEAHAKELYNNSSTTWQSQSHLDFLDHCIFCKTLSGKNLLVKLNSATFDVPCFAGTVKVILHMVKTLEHPQIESLQKKKIQFKNRFCFLETSIRYELVLKEAQLWFDHISWSTIRPATLFLSSSYNDNLLKGSLYTLI